MHIIDLLRAIGKPTDKNNRISLSGSLAAYVRSGSIFERTAPNTFGIKDMETVTSVNEPPDDFGLVQESEEVVLEEA